MSRYRNLSSTLYVRNISDRVRTDDVRRLFEKYGEVLNVTMPLEYHSRLPKGYAFIEYEDSRDAEEALNRLNHTRVFGRELEIEFARGDRKSAGEMRERERERRFDGRRGDIDDVSNAHSDKHVRESPRSRSREHRSSKREKRSPKASKSRSKSKERRSTRSRTKTNSREKSHSISSGRGRGESTKNGGNDDDGEAVHGNIHQSRSRSRSKTRSRSKSSESRSRSHSPASLTRSKSRSIRSQSRE